MPKYIIVINNADGTTEELDEIFDDEELAEEYATYYIGCGKVGAEILNLSNPGDYSLDDYVESEYEIYEVDDDYVL